MSDSPLINAIIRRLCTSGYTAVATPFSVATVSFEFTGALRGRDGRALDLVLLIDTTTGEFGDRDAANVRQRIQALSRALDVTRSRYVLTVILAGATLVGDFDGLSDLCRVLYVEAINLNDQGELVDDAAKLRLDDRIRVLLPLQLPNAFADSDAIEESPMKALIAALGDTVDAGLAHDLITASEAGEDAVEMAMAKVLEKAVAVEVTA